MIDRIKFDEQFQYFDKELVVEIIDIFFSEFEERFIALHDNVQKRDYDKLKYNAHSLKGVIANFWDQETVELSRRLDEMAKNKLDNGLEQTLKNLEEKSRFLLEELAVIKKGLI